MRVDLLAVLLLEAENHLYRWERHWSVVARADELLVRSYR